MLEVSSSLHTLLGWGGEVGGEVGGGGGAGTGKGDFLKQVLFGNEMAL